MILKCVIKFLKKIHSKIKGKKKECCEKNNEYNPNQSEDLSLQTNIITNDDVITSDLNHSEVKIEDIPKVEIYNDVNVSTPLKLASNEEKTNSINTESTKHINKDNDKISNIDSESKKTSNNDDMTQISDKLKEVSKRNESKKPSKVKKKPNNQNKKEGK